MHQGADVRVPGASPGNAVAIGAEGRIAQPLGGPQSIERWVRGIDARVEVPDGGAFPEQVLIPQRRHPDAIERLRRPFAQVGRRGGAVAQRCDQRDEMRDGDDLAHAGDLAHFGEVGRIDGRHDRSEVLEHHGARLGNGWCRERCETSGARLVGAAQGIEQEGSGFVADLLRALTHCLKVRIEREGRRAAMGLLLNKDEHTHAGTALGGSGNGGVDGGAHAVHSVMRSAGLRRRR